MAEGAIQSKGKGQDLLFLVMEQCKSSEKQDHFVQEVTCAPEPMTILAATPPHFLSWESTQHSISVTLVSHRLYTSIYWDEISKANHVLGC